MYPSKEFQKEWINRPEHAQSWGAAQYVKRQAAIGAKRWGWAAAILWVVGMLVSYYDYSITSEVGVQMLGIGAWWFLCVFLAFIPMYIHRIWLMKANALATAMIMAMRQEYREALSGKV